MFVHLHTHSEYSWDGVSQVKQLLKKAEMENMNSMAVTDHHTVFGWFDLNKEIKRMFLKPLFGMEINVGNHHLTAIAMNNDGLENLIKINNLGYLKNGKPRITEKELFEHHKGIVILSGCTKGKLQNSLYERNFVKAMNIAKEYKKILGDRYYIEVQRYHQKEFNGHLNALVQVAKRNEIPMVPTNDVHYLEEEDARIQEFILKSNTAGKISVKSNCHYFKTQEEMKTMFPTDVLLNTEKIVSQCFVQFEEYFDRAKGSFEMPLSMFYRFDDKEALKKILYSRKEYRLAEYFYKKMKKSDLTLEDLDMDSVIQQDILAAYGIRGRISKIETDPYYFIKVDKEKFPYFRKNKEAEISAQMGYFSAKELGFTVNDRRKINVYMN